MWARFVFMVAGATSIVVAQKVIEPEERARFNAIFEGSKGEHLKCSARGMEPVLDFAFRFELRYTIDCEARQFGDRAGELAVFLRVRPEDGNELLLGDRLFLPSVRTVLASDEAKHTHGEFHFSGALAAGTGVYGMELLVMDGRGRVFRHHWTAKAMPHGRERSLSFAMQPNTLAPFRAAHIAERTANTGAPITVIVNAAPLNPRSLELRAWDRAFLLDSLSSLLRQLSYSSVRVIAFNLEQRQELFHQDNFDQRDMRKLNNAFRTLELGAISYDKLENKRGWAEFLLGILQAEARSSDPPSRAVVFLGPMLRLYDKPPSDLTASFQREIPPPYCVTYYPRVGADFADSLQQLTTALKGKVFRIHSPAELAQNLAKLERNMEESTTAKAIR